MYQHTEMDLNDLINFFCSNNFKIFGKVLFAAGPARVLINLVQIPKKMKELKKKSLKGG